MSRYYNKASEPISRNDWCDLVEQDDDPMGYKRVGYEERAGVQVSTVWVGIAFRPDIGPPMLFESMVFGGDRDGDQYRYATLVEAEAGHARLVAEVFG